MNYLPDDIDMCFTIVEAAKIVFTRYCEENDKTGAILAITKRDPNTPILIIQIGEVKYPDEAFEGGKLTKYVDYAKNKARFLQLHPEFTKSSQNAELSPGDRLLTQIGKKEVVGGAEAFGDWILSASGVSSEPIIDEMAIESVWRVAQIKKAYIGHSIKH